MIIRSNKIRGYNRIASIVLVMLAILLGSCRVGRKGYSVSDQGLLTIGLDEEQIAFSPRFTIFFSEKDPKPAMRPAGIAEVKYNVLSWKREQGAPEQLAKVQRQNQEVGDGFDQRILEGDVQGRTANLFMAGRKISLEPEQVKKEGEQYDFSYKDTAYGKLTARLDCSGPRPLLSFEFTATRTGYYSIGYTGAPSFRSEELSELWQPLIWQEKRFPDQSYMTLAFRCPLPTALVASGRFTYGTLAHPSEFPFEPLPLMENSRFGVALRNEEGKAQPMLFAPVLGGLGSKLQAGEKYRFKLILWAEESTITSSFEQIATEIYGFGDYRKNAISSLNETLENMVDYSLSDYAWFVDSLKGFAYSTDVPGAVKNVSSLHPWEIALVMGLPEMFEKRAWPLTEYMLSREKFLFSLDREQKIQHPSRRLLGPVAPVSELTALHRITAGRNDFLLDMAIEEYHSSRVRNLDVKEEGNTWQNSLALYKATGKEEYLEKAETGAAAYIEKRIDDPQTSFEGKEAFFWTGFTPDWIGLSDLYETTGKEKYLHAAQQGARQYAMFCWMSPKIPEAQVLVNKGGKAPVYWYLKNKGHQPMYSAEEQAPAWRLSAIGLTPESSGTSTGHRAIFMANYAPWMLRIGYYANDRFLMNIAKAAIIGRYRNFPGYHINTARTTIYEKEDYPLRPHQQLSVNSFHYNHILPMAAMLLDYLVTDIVVRSEERIRFPSAFIEGYAYLKNKFYGFKPGVFYGDSAWLWMPPALLEISSRELNYIAARGEDQLMIAFSNQSGEEVTSSIEINPDHVPALSGQEKQVEVWVNNQKSRPAILKSGKMQVRVPAGGITAIKIKSVKVKSAFQHALLSGAEPWENNYTEIVFGNAKAMILKAGEYKSSAYIFLQDDDSVFEEVTLEYWRSDGQKKKYVDTDFPYEFSVPLQDDSTFSFRLLGVKLRGEQVSSKKVFLSRGAKK